MLPEWKSFLIQNFTVLKKMNTQCNLYLLSVTPHKCKLSPLWLICCSTSAARLYSCSFTNSTSVHPESIFDWVSEQRGLRHLIYKTQIPEFDFLNYLHVRQLKVMLCTCSIHWFSTQLASFACCCTNTLLLLVMLSIS